MCRYNGKSGDSNGNSDDSSSTTTSNETLTAATSASTIWLSILGEVYDVSEGKEYYGPGTTYNVFAGRDASASFITGKFSEEDGDSNVGVDTLTMQQLPGLETWREFYQDDPKYKFVGLLIDPRYYDNDGNPTPPLLEYRERLKTALELQQQEREERKLKLKQRKEKQKQQKSKTKNSTKSNNNKNKQKQKQQQKQQQQEKSQKDEM